MSGAQKEFDIVEAVTGDYPDIRKIYIEGMETGNATYDVVSDIPKEDKGEKWFSSKMEGSVFKAVSKKTGEMLGWTALAPCSARRCYRGVASGSIYVSESARGRGVGKALLKNQVEKAEEAGIWTLEAGIFPENELSIEMHKKEGFRIVGVREKIGAMIDGTWRDVVFMERRSKIVGQWRK